MLTLYRKSTGVQKCHDKFHFIKLDVTINIALLLLFN